MASTTAVQFFRVETDRLTIQPVRFEDLPDYVKIYSDKEVRQWMADGNTLSAEKTAERVKLWVEAQGVPLTDYPVRLKNRMFVGSIHLSPDSPGVAEFSYMFVKTQQKKGYCSEAAGSIIYEYVPTLVQRKCLVKGVPLTKIVATVKPDNIPSKKILEKLGMSFSHVGEKFGGARLYFILDLNSTDYQIRCFVFNWLKSISLSSIVAEYVGKTPASDQKKQIPLKSHL